MWNLWRFIKDFAKLSTPLADLLKKDPPYSFSNDCVEAFQWIKKIPYNTSYYPTTILEETL
jgi:hypothetical protein